MAVSKNRNFAKIANDVGADGTLTANALAPDIDVGGATVANTRSALPLDGNSIGDQAYVTDTSRLYIWNGNGWFSTALVNTTPTITNAPLSVYNLYANGAPTIITLAATDEDGDTLTWSYSSASASGKATITQADNVFTITPLTDIADTSFTIDFQVTDGVNVSTASSTINIDNRAPVIGTAPAASYVLATDGSPTVITLAATDPDGGSITWSYAEVGLTNQATIAQNGNEFTITPATTPQEYADFTITFTASDSIESTSTDATTFSLTFVLLHEAWSDTVLSIGTSSTNSLGNSTFIDRSTNAHTVTTSGSPIQTAFHPYLDNWSVEFDGTNDWIQTPVSNATDMGTGDFTIECWFYRNATAGNGFHDIILSNREDATFTSGEWSVYVDPNDGGAFGFQANGSNVVSGGICVTGQWHHVAVVRSSGTISLYVDGTSVNSASNTAQVGTTSKILNVGAFGDGGYKCEGYVSNVRLVNGTALYTSTFTPPTEKLTAVTGTSLLACQSNRFIDNSTNAHSITVNGTPEVSASNPFGQGSEYAAGENKGSIAFETNNQVQSTGSIIDVSTGDFTIEFWSYGIPTSDVIVDTRVGSTNSTGAMIQARDTGYRYQSSSSLNSVSGLVPSVKQWLHFAAVRNSGTVTIYHNGVGEQVTTGDTTDFTALTVTIGANSGLNYDVAEGYCSDLRITKSAVYTSNFTPPTAPVGNSNASLYLPMDNAGIFDKTGNHTLTPVGDASTSTSQTKFADTAMYFDGSGDDITIPNSSQFDFSNNAQFTLEFWMYPVSLTGNPTINFVSKWTGGSGTPQSWICYYESGEIRFLTSNFVYPKYTYSTLNQWVHIAVTSDGTNLRLFTDGILRDTVTGYSITEYDKTVEIGNNIRLGAQQPFNGYIENLQILKGVAKYTTNFTPPTQEQGRSYQAES